jgi:hypothetical protein
MDRAYCADGSGRRLQHGLLHVDVLAHTANLPVTMPKADNPGRRHQSLRSCPIFTALLASLPSLIRYARRIASACPSKPR